LHVSADGRPVSTVSCSVSLWPETALLIWSWGVLIPFLQGIQSLSQKRKKRRKKKKEKEREKEEDGKKVEEEK